MIEVATRQDGKQTDFDAKTSRESWLQFVHLPEGFELQTQAEEPERIVSEPVKDRPEHLYMFPKRGGTHVPGVLRYDSGFRNYHPYAKNSKT